MLRNKLLKGGIWLGIAQMLMLALQMISTVVAAWFLSPTDYGLVAIAMTIMVLLTSLTSMQLGEALIRHQSDADRTVDVAFTLGLIRGLLLTVIMAIAAFPIADFYGDQRLIAIILALSLLPLITGISNPCRFLQQRDLVFTYEVVISITQKLVGVITTLVVAYIYQSYWALVLGALIEQVFGTLLSYFLIRYRPRLKVSGFGKLLGFSIWLTLGQAVNTLNWHVEYLLIGKVLGPAPLGIYRMGGNLAQTPTAGLMTPIRKVVFPGFTSVINNPESDHHPERIRTAYQRTQVMTTMFALPIGVLFALTADPLVRLVLDPRWHEVTYIIQFLSAVFAFQTLGSLVQPLAMAKNKTRLLFVRDAQMLAIRLPIILTCLYFWAIPGVVVARVLTGGIGMVVNMVLVRRLIGVPVIAQFMANFRAFVSIGVMAAGVALISRQFGIIEGKAALVGQIAFEICAGLLIYGFTMVLTWILAKRPKGPETELYGVFRKKLPTTA